MKCRAITEEGGEGREKKRGRNGRRRKRIEEDKKNKGKIMEAVWKRSCKSGKK